jgi:hypothetical protein
VKRLRVDRVRAVVWPEPTGFIKAAGFDGRSDLVRSVQGGEPVVEDGMSGRNVQRHGHSSIANETVFEPRGLNRELQSLVHQ